LQMLILDVARLNFSHGTHESHGNAIKNIREAVQKKNSVIAIMLDTKGPEIRTGFLKNGTPVDIEKGQTVKLTTDYSFLGDSSTIAVSYKNLPSRIPIGGTILVSDGTFSLTVNSKGEDYVICTANNSTRLGEKKNVNLPGVDVDIETITEQDRKDLQFGAEQGVDMVAASFVRTAEDVRIIREALGPKGKNVMIIAKIENHQGLVNYDAIVKAADGIMVARGDLGMEIPPEKVFLAQKMMISKANIVGKPVITATQMLESMIKNPRPTRAECTDVANAVFDGTDCVMLSGETASGDYPLQAIDIMSRVCLEAERAVDYNSLYLSIRDLTPRPLSTTEGVASMAVSVCEDVEASAIIVLSQSGHTARMVSKYCPPVPVLVLTSNPQVARQTNVSWGLVPVVDEKIAPTFNEEMVSSCIEWAKLKGFVKPNDKIIAVHGSAVSTDVRTRIVVVP